MKGNALSLALIMIAGSLAGCLASDSDGVPEISLTDEDITGLFDDYFMDFVNNSSVTVVNEIHYHNNTTVIEGDDSSTNSVVYNSNGTGNSDYPYYILDVTFDADSAQEGPSGALDYSLVNFNATWAYYDINTGGYRQGTFSVSCGNYYLLVNNNSVVNATHAGIDNNGDGDFDDAGVDNNGDGDYNDPGIDANGDGDYDDFGDTPPDQAPDVPPDVAPNAGAGVDNNGDGDYDDAGVDNNGDGDYDDAGVDNNGDGDFTDAGVDNNGDGDFDDAGDTLPDIAPDVLPDIAPDVAPFPVGFPNNGTYWENNDYYLDVWMNIHNGTIINILENYAQNSYVQQTCGAGQWYQLNQDWTFSYEYSIDIPEGFVLACVASVNYPETYQLTTFYRSEHFSENYYGSVPDSDTWLEWHSQNFRYVSDSNSQHRGAYISHQMSVDEFPHDCKRFAGNGSESEFKLTVTSDVAYEVRILFYYQLIPIQAVLQSE